MTNANPELRRELQRLTEPPEGTGTEWLKDQIRQMEELNKQLPHSVRLHTRCSEDIYDLNCFMFALGIEPHAVSDMRLGHIFPGEKFVQHLLADGHLIETATTPSIGIYFRDNVPLHAGKIDAKNVISKWGAGGTHIWQHNLRDVPASYGDEVRFFADLPTAVELYLKWAADHGL
jgi:hypothetical protein